MRCTSVKRLMDDHVDGLLPAGTAERLRGHLDKCYDCRTETEAARAASQSLASWGDLEPPPGCFDSILERIDQLPADARDRGPSRLHLDRRRRARTTQWLLTGGLAAAAAILIGIDLGTDHGPIGPRPTPVRSSFPTVSVSDGPKLMLPAVGAAAAFTTNSLVRRRRVITNDPVPEVPVDDVPFEEAPR